MMKNHGLRRFFSLLLAVFMVCTLLPTAALAEDTTGDDETQSKTVVVDENEKKTEPPRQEQPKDENPPAPEGPKTFTVTYTDGADGAVFANQVYSNLSSGTATPAFKGTPEREDYTFAGWSPEVAETVTRDATYVAKWDAVKSAGAVQKAPPRPQSNSTVVLHPSVNNTVTGVKVSVGGTLSGYTIKSISGYDITVDLGKYNVNNDTFRLPYAKDIWYGVDDNKVDYISWAGGGSNRRSEGASALLVNGKNTAYYYFKGAPVLPTFTLNYDANGGTGAPTSQTYKATSQYEMSHEFTISSQKPTRENYTFLGWSTNRNATTAEYQPNGKIIVTSTTTLYAVWKEDAPTKPTAPDNGTVKNLLGENAVQIICTNTQIGHGSKTFGLIDGTFTVYHNKNNCEVVINYFSPYVDAFNAAVNVPAGTHITDNSNAGQNRTKINLVWSDGKWTAVDAPAKYHVLCSLQPAKPTAPDHDDLSRLIGEITVNCTNDAATHDPKSKGYALIADSYTPGKVEGSADTGYTFTVTVNAEKYVTQFDTDTSATHTPRDGSKVVTLKYENDAWTVKEGKPVSFDVACVAQPTFDELKELFNQKISVECNTKPAHAMARYDLIAGSYTIEDFSTMTDLPTCTVVLNSRKYVESFNGTTQAVHTPENEVKRVGLVLKDGKWVVAYDVLPVVFQVVCVPDAPTDGYLKDLLNEKVKVACINGVHATLVCDLIDGSYQGSGVQPDGNGGYTYTVTIAAAEYVKKYNAVWPHSLVKDEPTEKSVTLVWDADDSEWGFADPNAVPVIFNVECLYTVTYEDGVNGSVFKAVSFPNLKKGEATPTIEDPIRVGYKFAGWEPTVAATVTKDVTYIAQWKEVDTTFTVKYNDNVKGKAFKEQVYEDLKYNEETPDFNGKPERSGYTFTGWKPVVADRVTKDVVYYAQWKSNSGKDRVPKTGDGQIVMILGSVLLFSFCGATAVCLNDRKRKQG